ncbi:hypothetical protein GCM10009753_10520 [Streptantibioticus ferralitis]
MWIFGLFHAMTHTASARHPLAEQIGVSAATWSMVFRTLKTHCELTANTGVFAGKENDAGQPRGEPPGVGPSLRRGMRSAYEVCHAPTPPRHRNGVIDLSFS